MIGNITNNVTTSKNLIFHLRQVKASPHSSTKPSK